MQRNTKDWIHYNSAGIVLLAGIVLVYISFFIELEFYGQEDLQNLLDTLMTIQK